MAKIRVQNFGPIEKGYQENDGWLDVNKVTMFIGKQGSGKSTIAKLISAFTWMEKVLVRGDYPLNWFTENNRFEKTILAYHNLSDYITESQWVKALTRSSSFWGEREPIAISNPFEFSRSQSYLEFEGNNYRFVYENRELHIEAMNVEHFELPQIMYVPADRNFLVHIQNERNVSLTLDALRDFSMEYYTALEALPKDGVQLPINNTTLEYQALTKTVYLRGYVRLYNYKIDLRKASSGFQSLAPLYVTSQFLAQGISSVQSSMTKEQRELFTAESEKFLSMQISDEQKRILISNLASRFNKTAFINIVEEPEQNLFPDSQGQILYSLLQFNNMHAANKLIMTTHSPYLVNYLTIAIQGYELAQKIAVSTQSDKEKFLDRLYKIVPKDSLTPIDDIAIYQCETDGTISKLPIKYNLPSDENFLNKALVKGNDLFDQLLKIEQELGA